MSGAKQYGALPVTTFPGIMVDVLIVNDYADLPGGNVEGSAFGGTYTCSGTENPAGFPVPITGTLPVSFVAIVQVYRAGALIESSASPVAWAAGSVTVAMAVQPAAGDKVTYIIAPT